jgi:hypothetical protein
MQDGYVSDTQISDTDTVERHPSDTYELLRDSILKALRGDGSSTYIEGDDRQHIGVIVNNAMDYVGLRKDQQWRGVQLDQDKIQQYIHFDQYQTQSTDYWPDIDGAVAEFYHDDTRKRLYALWMREDVREVVLISPELPQYLILRNTVSGHITDIMSKTYDDPYYVSDTYSDA